MEITVRLTKDAEVRKAGNRQVVGLNGVINKRFKTKSGEVRETATFFDCSYWRNATVAKFLTKGTVVQMAGDIGVNAYKTRSGEARANITFNINEIISWYLPAKKGNAGSSASGNAANPQDEPDDLPF